MLELIETIRATLNLKLPVKFVFEEKENDSAGYYIPLYSKKGLLRKHKIFINMLDCGRSFESLIAHEMIHAWQEENRKKDCHGKSFIKMSQHIQNVLKIEGIFDPECDK